MLYMKWGSCLKCLLSLIATPRLSSKMHGIKTNQVKPAEWILSYEKQLWQYISKIINVNQNIVKQSMDVNCDSKSVTK